MFGLNLKIGARVYAGCFAIVAVLIVSVTMTLLEVKQIGTGVNRMDQLRIPTSNSSQTMVRNLYGTLAALRGWMLTGNPNFKTERAALWQDIAKLEVDIDGLSNSWTNPENVAIWTEFKGVLQEFSVAQAQVETLANSPNQFPATKMLTDEAAPLATSMVKEITGLIDAEASFPPGPDEYQRKVLLGMAADVRGTLGLSLANIRAYLLTGDPKFQASFEKLWAKNTKRFGDLSAVKDQLKDGQIAAFEKFSAMRKAFAPLPGQMFALRGGKQWDAARHALATEAAPRAGTLLSILIGAKDADGARTGGMVSNQRDLLSRDAAEISDRVDALSMTVWGLLIAGLFLGTVVSILTARSIVRPVKQMTDAMSKLADKDLSVEVPALGNRDEIGEMAQAVQVFKENMAHAQKLEQEQERIAGKADAEKKQMMKTLADDFEAAVGSIINAVSSASTELQSSAETMTNTVERTSHQTESVATASEQASNNVQTVAAATEEMAASVQEIGRQASNSSQKAQAATLEAEQTVAKVEALSEAASKIGDVVSLIQDIAEQTNLLALNATIEAARAGEAGRGFAVVASEVKELASQTAKATTDISEQIGTIQDSTETSAEAIGKVTTAIKDLNDIASSIAAAVEEQATATDEISGNVQQAARATQDVSGTIGEVNQAVGESSESATQVLTAADELSKQSEALRTEVGNFLHGIRAA